MERFLMLIKIPILGTNDHNDNKYIIPSAVSGTPLCGILDHLMSHSYIFTYTKFL